jgi:hypothetical protein
MKKRTNRKHYSSYRNNNKKNSESSSTLGNQISAAIILCVFILIIAYTNSSVTNDMRAKVTAMISRNVVDEFEDKGNLKDNLVGIVKTVFSRQDEDTEVMKTRSEPIITNTGDEDSNTTDSSTEDEDSSQVVPPT